MEKKMYCPFCGNPSVVELRDTQSIDHEWFNDATSTINEFRKRAESAEAERDESRRQLSEAQCAIDVLSQTIVAQNNEIKRLRQQREDVEDYRAEIKRLNQAATA